MNIDQFKKQYPYYAQFDDDELSRAVHAKLYPDTDYGEFAKAFGVKERSGMSRGFETALGQTVPLMKGAIGLAADTVGLDSVADWGLRGYQEGMQKLQPLARENDDITVAWDRAKEGDVGALLDWASYAGGYTAGQIAETVGLAAAGALIGGVVGGPAGGVAGGAAGAAGKTAAKGFLRELVENQVEKRALKIAGERAAGAGAKEIAEIAASDAVKKAAAKSVARDIGAGVALGTYNLGQEAGTIYGEGASLAEKEGRDLDGADLARMWGSSIAAAATETVTDILGLKLGTGGIKLPGGRASRAATGLAAGEAIEGAQEGVQTGLERYGAGTGLDTPEAVRDYVNSIAMGAFAGGAVGGAGGLVSRGERAAAPTPEPQPDHPQDDAPAEQLALPAPGAVPMQMGQGGARSAEQIQAELDAERNATALYQARDEWERARQPVDPVAAVMGAETIDEAIAAAEQVVAAPISLPEMPGTVERTLGMAALDADMARRALQKERELGIIQESGRDAVVDQANEITRAQGFDAVEPTAMQIAMQRAMQRAMRPENRAPATSGQDAEQRAAIPEPQSEAPIRAETPLETVRPGVAPGQEGVVPQPSETITEQAHEAATSPQNELPDPTDAQKEAGNFRKGHVNVGGLDISIENPAGSRRRPEFDPLRSHYGYIRGTQGKDKDHIDVFVPDWIKPDYSGPVAVVNQTNQDGKFDEHKVILGALDEADARALYAENYPKGWSGGRSVAMFQDMASFKQWLADGDHTKPAETADALQVGRAAEMGSYPRGPEGARRGSEGRGVGPGEPGPEVAGARQAEGQAEAQEAGLAAQDIFSTPPPKPAGSPTPEAQPSAGRSASEDPETVAVRNLSEVRDRKPRPIRKLFGERGPTPEQAAEHAEQVRQWNADMRRARKAVQDARDEKERTRLAEIEAAKAAEEEARKQAEAEEAARAEAERLANKTPLSEITVTVEARVAGTGELVKTRERADVALASIDEQIAKARALLDCLTT